jgi:hypothetical protein
MSTSTVCSEARVLVLLAAGVIAAAPAVAEQPPWDVWSDLSRLALITPGDQGLLRSSHCPSGCGFDRHSAGDWRYIRVDGDEGVVFEETGPGALTRIWMTMGNGASEPLDPDIRIRIYVDDAPAPVVDLPLPELFAGREPPFLPPLALDRLQSGGGNVSYVPIPYRSGCRVTLVGAHEKKIWFQFSFRRLASADGVTSFTGREDLAALAALLSAPGQDPWPASPTSSVTTGSVVLGPGEGATLADLPGPDSITEIRLELPPAEWPGIELQLDFDGEPRVRVPLADFFAMGEVGPVPTRSLLLGWGADGALYSYFPMPFFDSARVSLRSLASLTSAPPPVSVAFQVRTAGAAPPEASGLFGAALSVSSGTLLWVDFPLLDLEGQGRWVGLFTHLAPVSGLDASYFEGDERVYVDGGRHPQLYGTGVEDFFGGGFGFDFTPFGQALHGSPYDMFQDGTVMTGAYRLMLADAVPFASRIRVGLEGGRIGDFSMRVRAVAYYYLRREAGLVLRDSLNVGDPRSRREHCYEAVGPWTVKRLKGAFEGAPPVSVAAPVVFRPPVSASFVLRGAQAPRVRIRRRYDAGNPSPRADVLINGRYAGSFPPTEANGFRRWRETDLDVEAADGDLEVTVLGPASPSLATTPWSEAAYELWSSPGLAPSPRSAGCPAAE